MTLNRTELMNAAWKETRDMMRMGYAAHQLREVCTYCLRRAWAAAKAAAAVLVRSAESLWTEAQDIENRDRLSFQGIELLNQLRRAYHASKAVPRSIDLATATETQRDRLAYTREVAA